jgi:hypothetical protein
MDWHIIMKKRKKIMKIQIKKLYFVLFLMLPGLFLFQNCAQPPLAGCIRPGMEQMKIRWGETIPGTGQITGYEIDSRARLFSVNKKDKTAGEEINKLGNVNPDGFCRSYQMIKAEIMRIQALNAPGDSSRFIEIISPATNLNFYAICNPKFSTVANKGFAAAYDSLMILVKK